MPTKMTRSGWTALHSLSPSDIILSTGPVTFQPEWARVSKRLPGAFCPEDRIFRQPCHIDWTVSWKKRPLGVGEGRRSS